MVGDSQTDFEKWREETAERERQLAENRLSEKEVHVFICLCSSCKTNIGIWVSTDHYMRI